MEGKNTPESNGDLHLTLILLTPGVCVRSSPLWSTILSGVQTAEAYPNHSSLPLPRIADHEEQTGCGLVDILARQ